MNLIQDLENGLILRHASKDDAQALAEFNGRIHGDNEADKRRIAAWTRDLLTKPHPTLRPEDFTIIEETATKRIVSSLNLIPQTWTYEGIEFGVGRPELVGTLPEYRGKGLVRAQFDVIHKWCEERGYPVQAITGIPYFYRQFEYEMALDLAGRRFGYESHVPKLKEGEQEKYLVRPVREADLSLIKETYDRAVNRHAIACARTPEIFKYELDGQSEDNLNRHSMYSIENRNGEWVGYLQHPDRIDGTAMVAYWYELRDGVSWLDVTPSVIRYLWRQGQEYSKRDGKDCSAFGFMGGTQHPVYEALGSDLPSIQEPYAYYLRLPNLPAFLNHIKPALENRLAESIAVGFTGELKVSFYRSGLHMRFETGRITEIQSYTPMPGVDDDAAFPGLTFIQLVFGYRSFDELHHAFADCYWENTRARLLLNVLFPKKLSDVFPLA